MRLGIRANLDANSQRILEKSCTDPPSQIQPFFSGNNKNAKNELYNYITRSNQKNSSFTNSH